MKADAKGGFLSTITQKIVKQERNEHTLKQILKLARAAEQRMDKIKIRLKNLEGDCFMVALTIAYCGAFSVKERVFFRKRFAEHLGAANVELSEYWLMESESLNSKLFKKIMCGDLGLKKTLTKLSHLFVDTLFCEFMVTLFFTKSTPCIFDPVGNFQDYLTESVAEEQKLKSKILFASDYLIS